MKITKTPKPYKMKTIPEVIKIRKEISQHINSTSCLHTLTSYHNYLLKGNLQPVIKSALVSKFGRSNGNDKRLLDTFINGQGSIQEKIELFNKIISKDGVFSGSKLLKYSYANLYDMINAESPLLYQYVNDISAMAGKMGYSSGDVGPGEFLLATFGKGINFAEKGDLTFTVPTSTNPIVVEVKGTVKGRKSYSGGRLCGTSGYGSPTSVRKQLYKVMADVGILEGELLEHGMEVDKPVIRGGFNLNISGLTNLDRVIGDYTDYNGSVKIFTTMLQGLYTRIDQLLIDEFLTVLDKNGRFTAIAMQMALAQVAFSYYKSVEDHDCVMFLNTKNGCYGIAHTADDIKFLYDEGRLTFTCEINWHDDRAKGSTQFIFGK
jgi:hypothetical protein